MSKVDAEGARRVAAMLDRYEKKKERVEDIRREDWFLIEVTFTPEALHAYADARAKYEAKVSWEEGASKEKIQPPFPLLTYDLADAHGAVERADYHLLSLSQDGATEQLAVRVSQFSVLEKRAHVLSVAVLDQGEHLLKVIEESSRAAEARRIAEFGGEKPQNPRGRPKGWKKGKPKAP